MNQRLSAFACTIAAALALGLTALAQTPPSGAFIAGPVSEVHADSLVLQGMTLAVDEHSRLFTVLPDGTMAPATLADVQPNLPMHARFIFVGAVPTLVRGELGNDFFWHGIVTAVGEGTITLDGAVTIHTSQARTVGAGTLQVGSTVGVKGEVLGGVYAAKVINASGLDFAFKGTITTLVQDPTGAVVGFTFGRGETIYPVELDANTLIWKGRFQVAADALAAGMKVDVTGWVQPDGSVLAWNVRVIK
jgi:hypothetical protein